MEQSDVFISYRRKDVAFVKQLVQTIKDTGRPVWVDWEDIPPGVEGFSDEIQRGIENANAFIAILSPAYIESEYCLMELREAIRLKKRIVPIVFQKFEPAPPPEGIGHINWVYFCPHAGQENSFEQSFPKVIQALEADYEHAREHTRLLTRAIEWDKRQHENSYLLKGAEIDRAEGWQVKATGKQPAATEMQLDYILRSRKQQRIQQRRFTITIGVLLVLAVIAGIYAVDQAIKANISAQISQSNALASAALQPGNEDIAVALALEATRSKYAPESAYKALAQVAYPPGGVRYFMKTDEDLSKVLFPAFSPDGHYVVIKDCLYDMATGKLAQKFENTPKLPLTGLFFSDGKRVVLAGDRDVPEPSKDFIYLGIYDVNTGKLLQKFDTGIGVSEVQLSTDEKTLIGYQPDSKIVWWDVSSGKKMRALEIENPDYSTLVTVSPDLKWMVETRNISEGSGDDTVNKTELSIIDTQTMKVQRTIPDIEPYYVNLIRFSNDSKEIAVDAMDLNTFSESSLFLINVESGQVTARLIGPSGITTLRYSPDGKSLVTSSGRTVIVWSLDGEILQEQTMHRDALIMADYVHHGERIMSMDTSGVIMTWDLLPGNVERQVPIDEMPGAMTPDGRYLILEGSSSDYTDYVIIRDTSTLEEISRLPIEGIPSDIGTDNSIRVQISSYYLEKGLETGLFSYITDITSPEYETILSTVSIASLSSGETLQTFDIPDVDFIENATISPSGEELYISYHDQNGLAHLDAWSIITGKVIASYIKPYAGWLEFVLRPDGSRVLIATNTYHPETGAILSGSVLMLDTSNQKVLFRIDKPLQMNMFFTPDGKQFAVVEPSKFGQAKGDVTVYNVETGKAVRQLTIDAHSFSSFDVQPDEKTFVTSSFGGGGGGGGASTLSGIPLRSTGVSTNPSFKQWNWSTGELIWEFPQNTYYAFFSPDRKRMFSMLGDSLAVWRFDSHDELVDWACANRYVPEFTSDQRKRFNIKNTVSLCAEREP